MVHGESDAFNQKRRLHIPLQREIVCHTSASSDAFNRLLNPLLVKHIESLKEGYSLQADRTGQDGCYMASNPILFWSIHKTKLHQSWKERVLASFLGGNCIGEIATEATLVDRLRLRFYIMDDYWRDLEGAINAIYDDMLSGNEGFGVLTGDFRQSELPSSIENEVVVVFLAASPSGQDRLRLDKEVREIDASLRNSALRSKFQLEQCWAVRASDFQSALLRYRPHIIHFSGHGTKSGELVVENDFGDSTPVPPAGLGRLFGILQDRVKCVVLSACNSRQQADEIAKYVDYVIGMSDSIDDESAIIFSKAFYEALGYGQTFRKAFELGKNAIELHNQSDFAVPILIAHE